MKTSVHICLVLLALCVGLSPASGQDGEVKPGVCPMAKCSGTIDEPRCQCDSDCLDTQKCCDICGNKCFDASPVSTDHDGFCPTSRFVIGIVCTPEITHSSCTSDSVCAADEKCCSAMCNTACVKALKEPPIQADTDA